MSDAESLAGSPEPTKRSKIGKRSEEEEQNDDVQQDDNADGSHGGDGDNDDSDAESDLLSEIDEDQFEDYDPATAQIEERPVEIDEDIAKSLKASKRKRADGEASKKPKEGRRDKKKKRSRHDEDDEVTADAEMDLTRPRKARRAAAEADGEGRPKLREKPEENEESLTPEERRRRALDRAMDAAIKNPTKRRRKKDDVDLEDETDEQIASLKIRMENACIADNTAREAGQPAIHKLKLLPEVLALLNRNNVQDAVLDPETNFLQSVKYFLEPLNDGSLPAYNIQRDIFSALTRLPIGKEVLLSSGIGKVVFFYTRSKRPQAVIKRMAERLVGEWSRPILKRTDDYKKRYIETRDFDYNAAKLAQRQAAMTGSQITVTNRPSRAEAERARQLAPVNTNPLRAQPVGLPQAYTIAPKSTFDPAQGHDFRPLGAGGMEAFRKMTQKRGKRG